jgi:CspA family cold shock protein
MASGRVKVFHPDREFGFITTEGGEDLYVHAGRVPGGRLNSGDVVEYEVAEDDGRRAAVEVTVVKAAPPHNPVGRTLAEPPTWDELEERERQRRMARRRRR